ncbi:DUF1403 family protein [Rhizobium ruizarguesonis]
MDSFTGAHISSPTWSAQLPGWALARGRGIDERDAVFAAGIALKLLDDLVRTNPPWIGGWHDRLALISAAIAARMLGRDEEESALRDAVLLTPEDGNTGPAGKLFLATRMLGRRAQMPSTPFVQELAAFFAIRWSDDLSSVSDLVDTAIQSAHAAPLAVVDLISAIASLRPDAEVLAFGLADVVLALKLKWPKPIPLLLPERFGTAFRTIGGRGRVRPGEPAYPKAICLAVVNGPEAALGTAVEIDRRAARLMSAAAKNSDKGG